MILRTAYLSNNLDIDLNYLCFFRIIFKKLLKVLKLSKKICNKRLKIIYENFLRLTLSYSAVILD